SGSSDLYQTPTATSNRNQHLGLNAAPSALLPSNDRLTSNSTELRISALQQISQHSAPRRCHSQNQSPNAGADFERGGGPHRRRYAGLRIRGRSETNRVRGVGYSAAL